MCVHTKHVRDPLSSHHSPTAGYLYAIKCIDKRAVKLRRAVKLVQNERRALELCDSPFISKLRYAFQTREVIQCTLYVCP